MSTTKKFELKIIIEDDELRIVAPNGLYWPYKLNNLPEIIAKIVNQCIIYEIEEYEKIKKSIPKIK